MALYNARVRSPEVVEGLHPRAVPHIGVGPHERGHPATAPLHIRNSLQTLGLLAHRLLGHPLHAQIQRRADDEAIRFEIVAIPLSPRFHPYADCRREVWREALVAGQAAKVQAKATAAEPCGLGRVQVAMLHHQS